MASQYELDCLFLDMADRVAQESKAVRSKVGAIITDQDNNILSYGWNGTPPGRDNCCEITLPDGTLVTKPEVIHAEENAFMRIARSGLSGTKNGTLYTRYSPCFSCSRKAIAGGIARVVYREDYRLTDGIELLRDCGVAVEKLEQRNDQDPEAS